MITMHNRKLFQAQPASNLESLKLKDFKNFTF